MRYVPVAIPWVVTLAVFSTSPAAQGVNWEGLLRQGVNEAIRSINAPTAPAVPYSSDSIFQTPASPQVSQGSSPAEQNVDARITDNRLGSAAEFRAFFNQLKRAVAASDKQTLAKMMNYPLRVSDNNLNVRTESDFIKHYHRIFTPHVISIVNNQTYGDLFVRDQGASMGSGEVWFTGVCLDNACNRRTPKVISVFAQ